MSGSLDAREEIMHILCETLFLIPSRCQDDATLDSLGMRGIDLLNVLGQIESQFGVYIELKGRVRTFGQLVAYVEANRRR